MSESTSTSVATGQSGSSNIYLNAIIGAVVTVVTSFIPFSSIIGGAVAAYLHKDEYLKVGALSGLFAAVPLVLVLVFAVSVFTVVPTGESLGFSLALLFGGLVLLVIAGGISAGLGALGGLITRELTKEN